MRNIAIIQARLTSGRLPKKVLRLAGGSPIILTLLKRLRLSRELTDLCVAIPDTPAQQSLFEFLRENDVEVVSGDEQDVLGRYVEAASYMRADTIIRITADCPLLDYSLLDEMLEEFAGSGLDYYCNNYPPTYPDGLDVEIFTKEALNKAHRETKDRFDREHVTAYFRRNPEFRWKTKRSKTDLSGFRWTVDEVVDLRVVDAIMSDARFGIDARLDDLIAIANSNPDISNWNRGIARNEGSVLGTGQKLWKRAKTVIPGGNMLLSKRSEMFLPDFWPSYFKSASGVSVTDLDDNVFLDMSIMGIGTNSLGYGHPEVDGAVARAVKDGNMATLNCAEEVFLAERLLEVNPWADMVRFARTGGEANAIAVRIARAAAGKDKVAICGYHGWHDWYLSANLSADSSLDGHLLPGLTPKGVPRGLVDTVIPFEYNDLDGLGRILDRDKNVGVIKMEVQRNKPPAPGFLEGVRRLATKSGAVLVFDECTSGFRETYGGLHIKYGVNPDVALFGKALGNGYAITAVVGKRSVMEAAQETFISSTFWTERIGSVAALATLKVMEQTRSWILNTEYGSRIKSIWAELSSSTKVPIVLFGLDSMPGFSFDNEKAVIYKTYVTQRALDEGMLASNVIYPCIAHSDAHLERYSDLMLKVFQEIALDIAGEKRLELRGQPCHTGFKRLN